MRMVGTLGNGLRFGCVCCVLFAFVALWSVFGAFLVRFWVVYFFIFVEFSKFVAYLSITCVFLRIGFFFFFSNLLILLQFRVTSNKNSKVIQTQYMHVIEFHYFICMKQELPLKMSCSFHKISLQI